MHAGARLVFGEILPNWPYPVMRGPLRGSWNILGATAGEAGGVSVHLGLQEVEQCRCLTNMLHAGQVFFDVGADVGSRIVQDSGCVIAFEPMLRNLAFLHRDVRLNRRGGRSRARSNSIGAIRNSLPCRRKLKRPNPDPVSRMIRQGQLLADGRARFRHVELDHELTRDRIVKTATDENARVLIQPDRAKNEKHARGNNRGAGG